jgi:hypothetical protein
LLTPTSYTLAKIDPSTIRNLGHFSAANMAVSTHRYDDLIATKLAGSSRRERRQVINAPAAMISLMQLVSTFHSGPCVIAP